DRLHGGERQHRHFAQPVFVADTADDGAADATRDVWCQAERRHLSHDLLQVVLTRVGSENDDHATLRDMGKRNGPGIRGRVSSRVALQATALSRYLRTC